MVRPFFGLVYCAGLCACGGSETITLNPVEATLSVSGTNATLTTNDLDVTLELDPEFDRGTFSGARVVLDEDSENDQYLMFSEGEASFAALLVTRETTVSADTFFDRTGGAPTLPSGQATLTGNYAGVQTDGDRVFSGPIEGVLTLNIDFDAMTLRGGVTERTLEALGLPFILSEDVDIVFPDMTITSDGTFAGEGVRNTTNEGSENEIQITTDVVGAFAGGNDADLEVVGSVNVETTTTQQSGFQTVTATTREVGVFTANN